MTSKYSVAIQAMTSTMPAVMMMTVHPSKIMRSTKSNKKRDRQPNNLNRSENMIFRFYGSTSGTSNCYCVGHFSHIVSPSRARAHLTLVSRTSLTALPGSRQERSGQALSLTRAAGRLMSDHRPRSRRMTHDSSHSAHQAWRVWKVPVAGLQAGAVALPLLQ